MQHLLRQIVDLVQPLQKGGIGEKGTERFESGGIVGGGKLGRGRFEFHPIRRGGQNPPSFLNPLRRVDVCHIRYLHLDQGLRNRISLKRTAFA